VFEFLYVVCKQLKEIRNSCFIRVQYDTKYRSFMLGYAYVDLKSTVVRADSYGVYSRVNAVSYIFVVFPKLLFLKKILTC
jgi:hypothetical protein